MEQTDISISINGKTHRINIDDPAAISRIPWEDRKQLIQVLEAIRQAEHVRPTPDKSVKTVQSTQVPALKSVSKPAKPGKVPQAHAEDIDVIMSQLIIEERKNRTQIPDRGVVIKWMLIIFAVIVLLSLLF